MANHGARPLRWYQGLSKYHWWVLAIGVMSWMFDCMDQRIFVLSRAPAVKELTGWNAREKELRPQLEKNVSAAIQAEMDAGTFKMDNREEEMRRRVKDGLDAVYDSEMKDRADAFGDIVTALMVVGWAVGGFVFGIYGDRLGRVKTLSIAIAVYSVFTGLSGLSIGLWDFCVYRFLMGCGIGGAFATAATLIAETMPTHARASALGLFQALSAVGNITGSFIARFIVRASEGYDLWGITGDELISGWRILFMIGVLPAILVVFIMRSIREPDAWKEARQLASDNLERELGDIKSLFGVPRWRRNTLVGVALAVIGVIGLWGVGFYSPELIGEALQELSPNDKDKVKAMGTLLQDVGALFGMITFTYVATRLGRKVAFAGAFIFCWLVVSGVFIFLTREWHVYVMLPVLGFATLSVFGGYSIYFPELFPTRLRSTGTGFCYNVGRILAAVVILCRIPIREAFTRIGFTEVFRSVSVVLASVYLLGLVVLIWAPETKDKPLPTDDDLE
ncbi:MAG: MFS transporter [Pirellulales bacterium]|nr:MFS transporter [Pirellulales bacterium]